MLTGFYKKFSLNSLKKAKPQGQIATLLILMIVVVLILILTTVNLGQLSLSSTNLSNVADSSAFSLASQLASKANAISQSIQDPNNGFDYCSPTRGCKNAGSGGFFGAILGAVLVVVAIVLVYLTWGGSSTISGAIAQAGVGLMTGAAAVGGAVGGGIGARMSGTSVTQGAFQGAVIGAAIGYTAGTIGTTVAGTGSGTIAKSTAIEAATAKALGITAPTVVSTAGSSTALAVANAGLFAASTLYNASIAQQNKSAAFSAAARVLNGLPDYDRFRENVFLQAFSQVVDDPNGEKVNGVYNDYKDLNVNGIVDEKVSHFLYWWDERVSKLKAMIPDLKKATSTFFYGTYKDPTTGVSTDYTLPDFKKYIKAEIDGTTEEYDSGGEDGRTYTIHTPGRLSEDGPIVTVAKALKAPFLDPKSGGSFDQIVNGFNDFIKASDAGMQGINLDQLTSNWQTLLQNLKSENYGNQLYDEKGDPVKDKDGKLLTVTDYYHQLDDIIGYLAGKQDENGNPKPFIVDGKPVISWKQQILDIRNGVDLDGNPKLPSCIMGSWGWNFWNDKEECQPCAVGDASCANECIVTEGSNPSPIPCKFDFDKNKKDGSIDANYNKDGDEIVTALNAIDDLVKELRKFKTGIDKYVAEMNTIYQKYENNLNPAVYSWSDSRCPDEKACHSVTVEVGPYHVPSTVQTENGGWQSRQVCINLIDYYDTGKDDGGGKNGTTWVNITRSDPPSKELKSKKVSLGMWNPFLNLVNNGKISKRGKAKWNFNSPPELVK